MFLKKKIIISLLLLGTLCIIISCNIFSSSGNDENSSPETKSNTLPSQSSTPTAGSNGGGRSNGRGNGGRYHPTSCNGGGLNNLGNTCYFNAALQTILRLKLIDLSKGHNSSKLESDEHTKFLETLTKISKNLLKNSTIMNSDLSSLQITLRSLTNNENAFYDGHQADSSEALIILIGTIENEAIKFDLNSTTTCTTCNNVSSKQENNITHITLEIPQSEDTPQQMQDLFDKYFAKETLNNENKYACAKCNEKTDATKQMFFTKPSYTLILILKRFNNINGVSEKIKTAVSDATELTLKKEFLSESGTALADIKYNLKGVIVHKGYTIENGHYYALIKNQENTWTKYDDNIVTNNSSTEDIENGYVFIYQKNQEAV